MSEQMLESTRIVKKQVTVQGNLIDKDDIIDVSSFDFDDTDEWLYVPHCPKESKVYNLYAWLKNETEAAAPPGIGTPNRKCVDTRTFVRPKKKSSRASFEALFETMLPPKSLNTVEDENVTLNKQDNIPSMLKHLPPHSVTDGFRLEETGYRSGQESMEVFLNMSHSKGIDSFINLTEPGFSDPIMNISQPSIFYSSITSLPRDDSLINSDHDDVEYARNLTHIINQTSNDLEQTISKNNINETFSRVSNISIASTDVHQSKANETFTNHKSLDACKLNETYSAENTFTEKTSHENINVDLGSTYINKHDSTMTIATSKDKEARDLNATYMALNAEKNNSISLNRTYLPKEHEIQGNNTIKLYKNNILQEIEIDKCTNLNTVQCPAPSVTSLFPVPKNEDLSSTFKLPFSMGPPSVEITPDQFNSTFNVMMNNVDPARVSDNPIGPDIRASTSLRKELLQEIKKGEDNRLDSMQKCGGNKTDANYGRIQVHSATSKENIQVDIPLEDTFHGKPVEASINHFKIQNDPRNGDKNTFHSKQIPDSKYYTFTKKTNTQRDILNLETVRPSENADVTFTKSLPKTQNVKTNMPRMFSKLPQFLQKSNPNLVSGALKSTGLIGRTGASNLTFMKGSQPNIVKGVEKSLNNQECNLRKMRSGSEQRLVELHTNATEFRLIGAAVSTDSINSTQSAHSAPDLDDRLSECSDNAPNLYAMQTMNIDRLHHIARLQDENLAKESTPKGKRQGLDNTWTELENNLPSPIFKNGVEQSGKYSSSSTTHNIKTSSPMLSPSGSSQSIDTDSQSTDAPLKQCNEVATLKKAQDINKGALRCDNKTKIRLPSNFYGGVRAPGAVSAIPRPPSRIPAFRYARPILKNTQSEGKEG